MSSQADLAKNQMMLFYTEEMVNLQTELQATADKLNSCDWNCVNECAKVQVDLINRAGCLDTCKCFSVPTTAQPAGEATPVALYTAAEFELQQDKIESDYDAQMNALNQAQRLAEEALRLKLQADLAAFRVAQAQAKAAAALAAKAA